MSVSLASVSSSPLSAWVGEVSRLTDARSGGVVRRLGGRKKSLTEEAVRERILIPLNENRRPGCLLHRSHPSDVARTEDATVIYSPTRDQAALTNDWSAADETYRGLGKWLRGSLRGRNMYVIPYLMWPPGSEFSRVGVELADRVDVALNMRIMTRMGPWCSMRWASWTISIEGCIPRSI